MNARITILKSVNTWTQCHSFVRRGSKRLLAFMKRIPNRGASPCRETAKTITKAYSSSCSWMGEKGTFTPPIAIPRTAQIPASFPAETSTLLKVVRWLEQAIRIGGTFQQKPGDVVHARSTLDELVKEHTRQFPDDRLKRNILMA